MRRWKLAVFLLVLPFVVTETAAVIFAWLASGWRGLALVFKRFGVPFRRAVKRAQGYVYLRGAWVKPGERVNRRRRS